MNEEALIRPLPRQSWLTAPFWAATARGELLVQRCDDCGKYVFRPEFACTSCLSERLTWSRSTGRGTLHSFSVVHRAPTPAFTTPYIVACVEMDEGWYMMSNLIDCSPEKAAIGMRLRAKFVSHGDIALPFMTPSIAKQEEA